MSYLAAGVIAFGMFLLYDLNSFTWKNRILHTFFLIGNVILLASTAACFVTLIRAYGAPVWRIVIFGALAVSQAALLIYTLFFALPFEKTYTRLEENPPVYTEGVYSLCRHPGVVWFFFLYLFLALLTGQRLMMAVCVSVTVGSMFCMSGFRTGLHLKGRFQAMRRIRGKHHF